MEKALEILKKIERQCQEFLDKNLEECIDDYDVEGLKKFHIETKEAIAELEEAMKPKECSKCKHIHQGWWCNENGIRVTLDFCCNRYEPKGVENEHELLQI